MINIKKYTLLFISLAALIVPTLISTPKAAAAAAICISNSSDTPNKIEKCSDQQGVFRANSISGPVADTCYYIDYPVAAAGGIPNISQAPVGSEQCKGWQKLAKTTEGTEPICYKIPGPNVNSGYYTNDRLTSDMLKKATCTKAMLSKQPAGSKISSFKNGTCYLVFANGSITQDDCAKIKQKTGSADATDKNKTSLDAKVAKNTGPSGSPSSALSPSKQQAQIQKDCKPANSTPSPDELANCIKKNPLVKNINAAINLLSGLVGVIVVIMVIIGGIQYMTAGGNPQAVATAKKRITNAILAIVALLFMYSFLQWLIPGGIF